MKKIVSILFIFDMEAEYMKKIFVLIMFMMLFSMNSNLVFGEESANVISIIKGAYDETCAKTQRCFMPAELTTCVGTEVIWINQDRGSHKISSGKVTKEPMGKYYGQSDGEFQSDMLASGETFSHKFVKSGTYEYFSVYFLHATGKIVVKDTCEQNNVQTTQLLSPLKQFKLHIPISEIECKKNHHLLVKITDGTPACVKDTTAEKLESRIWLNVLEYQRILSVCNDPSVTVIDNESFVACFLPPNDKTVYDLPPPVYKKILCTSTYGCSGKYNYVLQIPDNLLIEEQKDRIIQKIKDLPEVMLWPSEGKLDHFLIDASGPNWTANVQFFVSGIKMTSHDKCEYYDSVEINLQTLEIINGFRNLTEYETCNNS